jgi:hypothetical protein
MPEQLLKPNPTALSLTIADLFLRLGAALLLGFAVAWIYKRTRKNTDITTSFPTTLVLLSVLIAMVTQVIGDNVARAFSLVGALSIVRFRTVVRDTQDTAYVIFAVVIGMAVGAQNIWVGLVGLVVVGLAAFMLMPKQGLHLETTPAYLLRIRMGIGHDLEKLLGQILDQFLTGRDLVSIETAKQGVSVDFTYETRLKPDASPHELLKSLNRVEGVQNVELTRRSFEDR